MTKKAVVIHQIVQLRRVMRRWRALSLLGRGGGRPELSGSGSTGAIRSGFLAVYVGGERRRFVIPTRYLNLPVFAALLERAEEEYGFQPSGGLALPCDVGFFHWVLDALDRDEDRFKGMGLDDLFKLFSDRGFDDSSSSSCKNRRGSMTNSSDGKKGYTTGPLIILYKRRLRARRR